MKPRVKLRRLWMGGSDPGVQVFEVDPPLLPGEVEIDTSDLVDPAVQRLSQAELVAFEDMVQAARDDS